MIARNFLFVTVYALFLQGCVENQKTVWVPVNTTNVEFKVANGKCKSESYKAIPIDVKTQSDCDSLDGVAKGYCVGQARKNQEVAISERSEIYEACMLENGWKEELEEASR